MCKYSESCVFECEKDCQCPVSDIGALLYQTLGQIAIVLYLKIFSFFGHRSKAKQVDLRVELLKGGWNFVEPSEQK